MSDRFSDLNELLEALCEDRLSQEQCAQLEKLVLSDPEQLAYYLHYVDLHGMLHWDAAGGVTPSDLEQLGLPVPVPAESAVISPPERRWILRRRWAVTLATAACLLLGGFVVFHQSADNNSAGLSQNGEPSPAPSVNPSPAQPGMAVDPDSSLVRLTPLSPHDRPDDRDSPPLPPVEEPAASPAVIPGKGKYFSGEAFINQIDRRLAEAWSDHEVEPSPEASDSEWIRRVYLDLVGHIPPAKDVERFLHDRRQDKRARLVDELLSSSDFAHHFSTVWTNLLIGHTSPREVNRPALEKFLREQFHRNRPWSDTVARLISAEGYDDEDGATNFLLAHLNNEAVPATAVTSRVLLCEQVQCTQCHNHPTGEWKQNRFWELNAFFQQTEIIHHQRKDPKTGRRLPDRLQLVSYQVGGPILFEDRQSSMHVAYPKYAGVEVDPSEKINRRQELAKLLCAGENPQIARAMVNRMWAKFFGYGFTNPVDDMGPHNHVSHPELLDELSREFVKSGFDIKQLIRWIVLSRPYQLSSQKSSLNREDDPESGIPPLFSRMYVKPLTAEQLFDSLLVASQADQAGVHNWEELQQRRQRWLEQFYTALDNDENSEAGLFEGSFTQALVMMNGELIQKATQPEPGTVLFHILSQPGSDTEKIRQLSLAVFSRYPTPQELSRLTRLIRQHIKSQSRDVPIQVARREAFRDLMWAYLNASEFMTNH